MIRRVTIRRFKRFKDATFDLPGHVVLAGPNNTGKTTVLQAIAAWDLAFRRWRELNDLNARNGYTRAYLARQAFTAVPLRAFDMLFHQREMSGALEIGVQDDAGRTVTIMIEADTTEQVALRPTWGTKKEALESMDLAPVYVPPMSGLAREEPLYGHRATLDDLIGQARPGEVLRNLLVEASHEQRVWLPLVDCIQRLFGFTIHVPDVGAAIRAEYSETSGGPRFDIASAGSGFLQVLMVSTFLHARPGSVLLLDEPDAHLHVILQDAIFSELRKVAATNKAQLLIATHSEVVINSVDPQSLCLLLDKPRWLTDVRERTLAARALGRLTHADVMTAMLVPGVLYVEDFTDLDILRAWAVALNHRAWALLDKPLWKPTNWQPRVDARGISSEDHYEAVRLVRDIPAFELADGDGDASRPETPITGSGYQKLFWRRYEIESYLVHPAALARFCAVQAGGGALGDAHAAAVLAHFDDTYPPAFVRAPLGDHELLNATKARTTLIPKALTAGGLPGFPYTRYHEIAASMLSDEIHPEVVEKLGALCQAFGQ